jgi:hypothetical protein
MPNTLRSILAVAAGFVFIAVLAFGTDAALMSAGVLPPPTQPVTDTGILVLTLVYVGVYAIAGSWLAAALAPSHPMRHALILAALGLIFQVAMGLMTDAWGRVPTWYNAVALLLVMPYGWIGGRLRERQLEGRQPALATS